MAIPGWMSTKDTLIQFLAENEGEHSVKEIADGVWLSSTAVNQTIRFMANQGDVTRRWEGTGRKRHFVYKLTEKGKSNGKR